MSEPAPSQSNTGDRHGVDRLEAFSDGVFAVAITLLVLGIDVPTATDVKEAGGLGNAIADLLPNIYVYFLGFAVIGVFWIAHHAFFSEVERHDKRLLWTNLLFLSLIAAMPFSTGLMGEYSGEAVATIIFAGNVALAAAADRLSEFEAKRSGLLRPDSTTNQRAYVTRDLLLPAVFVVSIPIALVDPTAAQFFWLLAIPIGWHGPAPWKRGEAS